LFGSPTIREVSASGLGEVVGFTDRKYLAGPLVVKMTGPLLRIVGDRNPSNVKVAILKTLGLVLIKGGPALRAFVPQFQTTFVKALSDPSRLVRLEAIAALSLLMPLSTRVDPLIKELVAGSLGKSSESIEGSAATAVQTATLDALAVVLEQGGTKAKLPDCIPSALEASKKLLASPDEGIRESAAKVLGMSCALLGPETTQQVLQDILGGTTWGNDEEVSTRHGKASAIRRILASQAGAELAQQPSAKTVVSDLKKLVLAFLHDEKSLVREAGFAALGAVIGRAVSPQNSLRACEPDLLKVIRNSHETLEIHRAVARGLCTCLLLVSANHGVDDRALVDFMGLTLMDACLEMALKSSQRVQFAFNDVLWLALNVKSGEERGLNRYCELAMFDNQRSMKSLFSKVLIRIKDVSILDQ
jgi:rRNA-processing protein FCF1